MQIPISKSEINIRSAKTMLFLALPNRGNPLSNISYYLMVVQNRRGQRWAPGFYVTWLNSSSDSISGVILSLPITKKWGCGLFITLK